eukprot:TRINITY_DN8389_c0_g1_i2.p2 TRINITY_DN8389_c0_g1~~TRINITY_DN8389_c0_g1_i2.p2  ORF type:complete len:107 (-),score=0.55 TRINITY_DN8389_c0_g1_i2:187-507(-)
MKKTTFFHWKKCMICHLQFCEQNKKIYQVKGQINQLVPDQQQLLISIEVKFFIVKVQNIMVLIILEVENQNQQILIYKGEHNKFVKNLKKDSGGVAIFWQFLQLHC